MLVNNAGMETNRVDVQGLDLKAGIEKMGEMVKLNPVCFFITHLTEVPLRTRPMFALRVCDQGNFWFLSHIESTLNEEIEIDQQVQLLFGNTPDSQFLTIYGKASISRDRQKIAEIWNPEAKAWFPDGNHSPGITVVKVAPEEAHYWDTKSNSMISIIKSTTSPSRKTNERDPIGKAKIKRFEIGLNFMV